MDVMDVANIVNGHAERFVPAVKEFNFKTVYEHLHRYAYALQLVSRKRVLDLACGEGYGSWILADAAMEVVGVDKNSHVIRHAQMTYKKDNLKFEVGDMEKLLFNSGEFDVVVCFEAIEHIIAQEECIVEIRRVLRDGGILLISTPVMADSKKKDSLNPFHLKELTLQEFEGLLCKNFKHVSLTGQKVALVSDIWDISGIGGTSDCIQLFYEGNGNGYVRILSESKNRHPDYLLAIASDKDINFPTRSILTNIVSNEVDKLHEMEMALECASRIFKKKHEACSRHLRKLLVSEARMTDLEKKLTEKDKILQKLLSNTYRITPINLKTRPSTIKERISVIIPVKNGGEQLRGLLRSIRSQRKVENVEIIVIDSESTDNSVQIAKEFGAKIIQIPQKEFNHGATRNLGAKEASGNYLVFTVQDAMPINNYWLYNMICPFFEYPELVALSARQFVKPDADLFSLWMNEKIVPYDGDVIYSLSNDLEDIDWKFFDRLTKRRLTFFDNVSSCIKRSVFEEIQFAPLINAEDMDYGAKLLERRKTIGYLTSTGVYHWHERGADYVFKRHYIGTKASVYILKNELLQFFDKENINWECLAASIVGIYDLISISIAETVSINPNPIIAVKSFINALQKNMDTLPDRTGKISKIHEDSGLELLLREIVGDTAFMPEQKYNFNQNFLVPYFMKHLENFTAYLYSENHTLEGREKDFISCLYKIFAIVAGEALGAYYLEAENLNRLTPDLKRIDYLLGKGVCYF